MRSMRTLIIALAVAIAATAGGIAIPVHSAVAQAAQNAPLVVGIIDLQTLLKNSKAGQSLEKALQDKSKAINTEIGKTEQGLRAKRQKLEQSRSSLAPADFQAFAEDLARAVATVAARHHDDRSGEGRRFRLVLGAYPIPKDPSNHEPRDGSGAGRTSQKEES